MQKFLLHALVAAGVAALVSFVFAFMAVRLHAPDLAESGRWAGGALGAGLFFVLHLRSGTRRVAVADPETRARALRFVAQPGKALLYVVRTGFAGGAVGVNIELDGRAVAQLKSPRFTCLELQPGTHSLGAAFSGGAASQSQPAQQTVELAAGAITVLHVAIKRGLLKSQLVFEPWSIDHAMAKVDKVEMVVPERASAA